MHTIDLTYVGRGIHEADSDQFGQVTQAGRRRMSGHSRRT
jgi:hypothetical protein